jgi:hypothetical protein
MVSGHSLQKEIAEIISKNALVPRDYPPVECMGFIIRPRGSFRAQFQSLMVSILDTVQGSSERGV